MSEIRPVLADPDELLIISGGDGYTYHLVTGLVTPITRDDTVKGWRGFRPELAIHVTEHRWPTWLRWLFTATLILFALAWIALVLVCGQTHS